jgi:hypothetical protein
MEGDPRQNSSESMNPPMTRTAKWPLRQTTGDLDAIYRKIAKRIIPFLVLLFLMAWLDRYNLGFAKLQMVKDLGFSESVYGFGAGSSPRSSFGEGQVLAAPARSRRHESGAEIE